MDTYKCRDCGKTHRQYRIPGHKKYTYKTCPECLGVRGRFIQAHKKGLVSKKEFLGVQKTLQGRSFKGRDKMVAILERIDNENNQNQ